MKIYFILTAILVISALTIPLVINEISYNLTADKSAYLTQENETAANENNEKKIKLLRTSSEETVEIDMFEYITGTVAGEMPASFSTEALKAQAVASYTYAKYVIDSSGENDTILSDSPLVHQSYIDKAEQKQKWGEHYDEYRSKIEDAVNYVYGQYLTFDGKTAMTVYHALSINKTNSAEEIWNNSVPYLISVDSPDVATESKEFSFDTEEFIRLFKEKGNVVLDREDSQKWAKITKKSEEGYIRKLTVGNKTFSCLEIKEILSLASANFTAKYENDTFTFKVYGKGHGVGMSQYGAEYMSCEGKSYEEILLHYYTGTALVKE